MIKTESLRKSFSGKTVLDGIDVEISDGEIFGVMGLSGSGKSTFIKCLVRLVNPDGGRIIVDGRDILKVEGGVEMARFRRKFGYLFQEGALFDSLNVLENVCFGLRYLTDISPGEYARVAREKLELVGLKGVENMRISELSGGMKKRVALARAIAAEPKYMLYDEPTTGLDPSLTKKICRLIKEMQDRLGITSIIVTHKVEVAFSLSDRIAILMNGKFKVLGTPEEIRNSTSPIVKEFTDRSECF